MVGIENPADSAVAQPVLDANALEEARVGRAAEDHAGDGESRVVGIVVVHLHGHADQEERVLLIGRFDLVVDCIHFVVWVVNALVVAGALPIAEELRNKLLHLLRIELPADDDLAFACAVKLLVELAHIVERHLLQILDLLIDGGCIARVAARIAGVEVPAHVQRRQCVRFGLAALNAGDTLLADLFEFGLGE